MEKWDNKTTEELLEAICALENKKEAKKFLKKLGRYGAMKVFEDDIKTALTEHGFSSFQIKTVISPAWTTDWISQEGRIKLEKYGIAPPLGTSADKQVLFGETKLIPCPQCKSKNTKMISQFGSTACKALYRCEDCLEPFDYFKCL